MATTRQQSRSTRPKPAANGKSASAASRGSASSASRTRKPSTAAGKPSTAARKPSTAARKPSAAARKPSAAARSASAKPTPSAPAAGNGTLDSARSAAAKLAKPALAGGVAVAGIVGGAVLRAKTSRKRRFPVSIGNPLSGVDVKKARKQIEGLDINKARKQIGRASKQFGELTREIRKAGEQAERIGDALS
jgi:hypothetical protein